MAKLVKYKLSVGLVFCATVVGLLAGASTALATSTQPPETEPVATPVTATPQADPMQAMIDALKADLLNNKADAALRYERARLLLQNPKALPALLDILQRSNNIEAKDIICRAIANQPAGLETLSQASNLPTSFIEPLFALLLSDNERLSLRAAQALAKCRDGVVARLAAMLDDTDKPLSQRLAAITALEQMPGKEPVMALGAILEDEQTPVRERAVGALAAMLQLPEPVNIQQLNETYLPLIEQTEPQAFIRWQFERAVQQSRAVRRQLTDIEKDYLLLLTEKFQATSDVQARLDMLTKRLHNPNDALLRVWAADQIRPWKDASTAQDGALAATLVEMLTPFIADANPQVRRAVAQALPTLAKTAQPTASLLLDQLKCETDPAAQIEQVAALGSFEYTPVLDEALTLLNSNDSGVVAEAVRTLGKIAAAKEKPLAADQIQKIAQALTMTYQASKDAATVKADLIFAMRKIAAQPDYRDRAAQYFDEILRGVLADPSEMVRQHAIKSLALIHQEQVLPLLLEPKNLLNDPDTAVRVVVIQAIQDYPDKSMLKPLKARLDVEEDPGTARDIRTAYIKILQTQPLEQICAAARELQTGPSRNNELFDSMMGLLAGKIVQAKTEGQVVPIEYEVLVLKHQADNDVQSDQPGQALHRYNALLNLDLPDQEKTRYRMEVLQIALNHAADAPLLTQAQLLIKPLLTETQADAVLERIAQTIDERLANESLLEAAALAAHLVGAPEELPPAQRNAWRARRTELASKLLGTIEAQLKSKSGQVDPKAIEMLGTLDGRLIDYPADQSVQERLAALDRFRELVEQTPAKP